MSFRKQFLIILAGAFPALAFPPFTTGFLAYTGLVPLLYWLRGTGTGQAMQTGFAWGLGFNTAALYWICYSTIPGGIAAIFFLALLSIIIPVLYNFGYRVWGARFVWAFPFLWVGWEYIRSLGDIGFPWVIMGNTQSYYPALIQYISYTGIYGVSLWICFINVLIYKIFESSSYRKKAWWGFAGVLLIVIPYVHGKSIMNSFKESGDSLRVSLIQGNIDPWAKWDKTFKNYNFQVYEDLTREAARHRPDLLIWPESASTSYLRYDARYFAWVKKICDNLNIPIFTGALDAEFGEERKSYNAAFLFLPHSEELQKYTKMQLVPMSERFPFKDKLPSFFRIDVGQGPSDFSKGTDVSIFHLCPGTEQDAVQTEKGQDSAQSAAGERDVTFAAVICYESIFSSLVRRFCELPADFLVIITNDAWFGHSSGTYQHARYAVLRAIEHRISVARCANTGISMFINPLGEVIAQTSIEEPAVLTHTVSFRKEKTYFTEHGDWLPKIILYTVLFILIISVIQGIKMRFSRGRIT